MIVQSFPAVGKKYSPPVLLTSQFNPLQKEADKHKISIYEFNRRNDIIKKLYTNSPVVLYGKYMPAHEDNVKKYGVCEVTHLISSMWDWPVDQSWPSDNDPLIVTFRSERKPDTLCICTTAWLNPKNILITSNDS